jgi:hypothetical protein
MSSVTSLWLCYSLLWSQHSLYVTKVMWLCFFQIHAVWDGVVQWRNRTSNRLVSCTHTYELHLMLLPGKYSLSSLTKIRIAKFCCYELLQWSAYRPPGLASEREFFHPKFSVKIENSNHHRISFSTKKCTSARFTAPVSLKPRERKMKARQCLFSHCLQDAFLLISLVSFYNIICFCSFMFRFRHYNWFLALFSS